MGAVLVNGLNGREGNTLLFSNFDTDFYGSDGNKIYNFEMDISDEDTLSLLKDLAGSSKGDVFTASGEIPEELKASSSGGLVYFKSKVVTKHDPKVGVPEQFKPSVQFEKDGTFDFTEN